MSDPVRVAARTVRLRLLAALAPVRWRCIACGDAGAPDDELPCERCGLMMHASCYQEAVVTPAEHAALAAAVALDTAEELLDQQIVLCRGCRS